MQTIWFTLGKVLNYKKQRPTFKHQQPVLKKGSLISQAIDPHKLDAVLDEFI